MRGAIELIAAERDRQVNVEGWTIEHDEEHDKGELAIAAACYALAGLHRRTGFDEGGGTYVPVIWPWERAAWKPTPDDRIRELVKAGALIVAEIERLQWEGRTT